MRFAVKQVRAFLLLVLIGGLGFVSLPVGAQVSNSTNYTITEQVIGAAGDEATSANYRAWDTVGEIVPGFSDSASYTAGAGYRFMRDAFIPYLALSLSTNAVDLGLLEVSTIKTGSVDVTVDTNAQNGYQLKILEDGNFRLSGGSSISDVADAEVTVGSEEYGFRTTGSDALFNSVDEPITSSEKNIATSASATPSGGTVTTVTFKAAISSGTPAGNYSHVVTKRVIASF